ncbi:MAG: AI-2E family transporter [Thermomonas sp.]
MSTPLIDANGEMVSGTIPEIVPDTISTPAAPALPGLQQRPRAPASLVVLAALAVGYTLWATQDLILPVLLAMFFALVGNPIIRLLQRIRIPRFIAALAVLCSGLALAVLLGQQLIQPAGEWIREAPRELRSLAPKLQKLAKPVQEANKAAENIARAAGGESTSRPVQVVRTEVNDPYRALTATPRLLASILAVVLLTFFFMVYGQDLQRHAIALLPDRQKKKVTVEILQTIESEVSRYVLTISVINAVVGLVFAGCLYFGLDLPLDQALLWGTLAAILNFAPYVGPLIGIVVMLLMGFSSFNDPLEALLPAAIYLGLHTLEGQIVTPIVLGKRMALSPLILILALMVFGWMWGIIGLLLAVPMLVCVKIVLTRLDGMEGWAKLLE